MNQGKIVGGGRRTEGRTGGDIEGSTRGPRGPKNEKKCRGIVNAGTVGQNEIIYKINQF